LVLVDVDLGKPDAFVGVIGSDLVEDRPELLARPAPVGPEIEDDERGHRGMDDLLLETLDRLALGFGETQRRHLCPQTFRSTLRPRPYGGLEQRSQAGWAQSLAEAHFAMLGARLTSAGTAS